MARKSKSKSVQLVKTVKRPAQPSRDDLLAQLQGARSQALDLVTGCILSASTRLATHGMTVADIS